MKVLTYSLLFFIACYGLQMPSAHASKGKPIKRALEQDTVLVPFSSVFTEVFESLDEQGEALEGKKEEQKVLQLEGIIDKISGATFRNVILKNSNGERLELLWFKEAANGQKDYWNTQIQLWKNKNVRVSYKAVECYLPKQQQYITLLKITDIQLLPTQD